MIRPETSICDVVMIHRSTPPEEHMAEKPIDDEEFEAPDLEIDLEADDLLLVEHKVRVLFPSLLPSPPEPPPPLIFALHVPDGPGWPR